MRATLRLSSPAWFAQPRKTSSIVAGIDARALDGRGDGDRGEVVGPDTRERAAVPADGRAHRREHHGPSHPAMIARSSESRAGDPGHAGRTNVYA